MRPEYPSGLVLGPGIGRSPVRFPAPRRSFRGHFFVNFGMSWDVSGSGLGTFSDGFGKFWEKCRTASTNKQKNTGSMFPESGKFKNHMFRLSPVKNNDFLNMFSSFGWLRF